MIGVTVCVNYSDLLQFTMPYWIPGLDRCIVVTDCHDEEVTDVWIDEDVTLIRTDAFYDHGATFNKGGAMAEAFDRLDLRNEDDWICLFDADIMPPPLWWVGLGDLEIGNIYTAPRWNADRIQDVGQPDLKPIADGPDGLCGYFLLFHSSDPHCPSHGDPMFSSWKHAGNYDTDFTMRWPEDRYCRLPLRMVHIGTERNWWGKGNRGKMPEMYQEERRAHGGTYEHERVGE